MKSAKWIVCLWAYSYIIFGVIACLVRRQSAVKANTIIRSIEAGHYSSVIKRYPDNWASLVEQDYKEKFINKWQIFLLKELAFVANALIFAISGSYEGLRILILINTLGFVCFEFANFRYKKSTSPKLVKSGNSANVIRKGYGLVISVGTTVNLIVALLEALNAAL